jgi:Protein involved in formate dehydrogenase formation
MQLPASPSPSPWPARRRRAEQLRERHPFAAEVLTLYLALLEVQEPAFEAALARPPEPAGLPAFLVRELLPRVLEATVAAGPAGLGEQAVGRFHSADLEDLVGRWLQGTEQAPVDRYLARAAAAPVLEALEPAALMAACSSLPPPTPRDQRVSRLPRDRGGGGPIGSEGAGLRRRGGVARCPHCGGTPQTSFLPVSSESLVSAPRRLLCARCAGSWVHTRMVCAGCGEATGGRLPVYEDGERFPHLRIEGCETCRAYLVAVDLRRDAAAVPEVDELAALPLDLYAKERGLRKVTPNLMGM